MNDPLLTIVAGASAILFGYIGYVLGNFFPVIKKGQRKSFDTDAATSKASQFFNRLLRKDEEEFVLADDELSDEPGVVLLDDDMLAELDDFAGAAAPSAKPPTAGAIAPPPGMQGGLHVWYDRYGQKVLARMSNKWVDLDDKLSADQHGELSLLLIDLQDKVGVTAGLKAAVAKDVDQALAEEKEEGGFNPLKAFVNYVQADVPKLEDPKESIPEQINAILQEKIKGTFLEKRGITVAEWPDRGVVFVVGVDIYDDIHSIPDSDVRFAVRGAVKMWEVQHGKD